MVLLFLESLKGIMMFLTTFVDCLLGLFTFFDCNILCIWLMVFLPVFRKLVIIVSKSSYRVSRVMNIAIVS